MSVSPELVLEAAIDWAIDSAHWFPSYYKGKPVAAISPSAKRLMDLVFKYMEENGLTDDV